MEGKKEQPNGRWSETANSFQQRDLNGANGRQCGLEAFPPFLILILLKSVAGSAVKRKEGRSWNGGKGGNRRNTCWNKNKAGKEKEDGRSLHGAIQIAEWLVHISLLDPPGRELVLDDEFQFMLGGRCFDLDPCLLQKILFPPDSFDVQLLCLRFSIGDQCVG